MICTYVGEHRDRDDGRLDRHSLLYPGQSFHGYDYWERGDDGSVYPVVRVWMEICDDDRYEDEPWCMPEPAPVTVDLPYDSMEQLMSEWKIESED